MKRTFHLCLSSDSEVLFRDDKDYIRGFNCFALALYKTGSTGLAEAFMSTHCHFVVQTSDPTAFMHAFRMPYSKYFNRKYGRSGRLGELHHFELEIKGLYHHLAAISYVLRNPLHHGVSPIPYAYAHSSANIIFQKEMGKNISHDLIPRNSYYRHIGRRVKCPENYVMDKSGIFLRESVLDTVQVENMFVTPRNFNYYMGRRTNEDWIEEQQKDQNSLKAVSIDDIESGVRLHSVEQMLRLESGRTDYRKYTDEQVCKEIDMVLCPRFGKSSVYALTAREKLIIADNLRNRWHLGREQLNRCLII